MVPQRHHNSNDGVSQRVNSPRFSGPITRRAHSFKRNNNSNDINNGTNSNTIQNNGLSSHHEIDLPVNSPRSEAFRSTVLVDGFESGLERKTGQHVSQRTHGGVAAKSLLNPGFVSLDFRLREKRKLGHLMFMMFCGLCLFLGILKICMNGWFGSVIETNESHQVDRNL